MRLGFGLLMLLAVTCTRSPNSAPSGYVTDGAEFKWPINPSNGKVEISVCWEHMPADEGLQRDWVKASVTREFLPLNFVFHGWNACQPQSRGIRIVSADVDNNHVKRFGVKLDGYRDGMVLNLVPSSPYRPASCETSSSALKVCLEVIALHEFGHSIGLRHEADRSDSTCALDFSFGAGEQGAVAVGQYDPDSIMNYCATSSAMRMPTGVPRLSAGDVAAIKEFYFGSAQTTVLSSSRLCESEGNSWRQSDLGDSCCQLVAKTSKPRISENPPFKYCPVDLGFEISKLDFETLQRNLQGIDSQSFGFHTLCRYANGRRSQSYTEKMGLDALKARSTIWTAIEPQLGYFECSVVFLSESGKDVKSHQHHLEGSIMFDSMHPWPEDDIHKILEWKPSSR